MTGLLAKGQPPTDLWGQAELWWRTPILGVGLGGVTWGALIVAAIVIGVIWKVSAR